MSDGPPCPDCGWSPPDGGLWPTEGARAVWWMQKFIICGEGDWYGRPIVLRPDQKRSLFRWYEFCGGCGRWRYSHWIRTEAAGGGKALALDTPLATPSGWTTMGDVSAGDVLFDERGEPCRVTYTSPVFDDHDCYEVAFSDGERIVADADHLWAVQTYDHRKWLVRSTRELASDPLRTGQHWRYRLPMPGALALPQAELPVDPYILGTWLGDGATADARWTMHEADLPEFRAHVEMADYHILSVRRDARHPAVAGVQVSTQAAKGSWRGGRPSLKGALRELGVLGRKHIPAAYLRASEKQRLALLQGLMDTDGSVSARGKCEFTTTLPVLAAGVADLLASLGVKYGLIEGRSVLAGRDHGPKWRIQFEPSGMQVFRLARKQSRVRARGRTAPMSETRRIVGVRAVASVPTRCVQVDSPSRLYLAGRKMVQTHNTTFMGGVGVLEVGGPPEIAPVSPDVVMMANSWDQANKLFGAASIMCGGREGHKVAESPLCGFFEVYESKILRTDGRPGLLERVAAIAGTNEGGLPSVFMCDEVHELGDSGETGRVRAHIVIGKSTNKRQLRCEIPVRDASGDVVAMRTVQRGPGRTIDISTAGFDVDHSFFGGLYKHGKKVLKDPSLDPRLLFECWEADGSLDFEVEADRHKAVRQASPAAGILWNPADRVNEWGKPKMPNHEWGRYYANRWEKIPEDSWLKEHPAAWGKCQGEWVLAGDEATVLAMDMSLTRDSTAAVECALLADGRIAVTAKLWFAPKAGKIPHLDVKTWIVKRALELGDRFRGAVYDPRYFELIAELLEDEGILCIQFDQTPVLMAPAVGEAFDAIVGGDLVHGEDDGSEFSRQVLAAAKRPQERGFTLSKGKSKRRIDSAVALCMGVWALPRLEEVNDPMQNFW